MEWQHRSAKILLIRSWRLSKRWGTGSSCINMAEAIGFLLGEYTIPSTVPILYVTDSNNARTLQRNVKNLDNFTHRRKIRSVKQGIDYGIANHLEYLTTRWPRQDQLSPYAQQLYNHGIEACSLWAMPPMNEGIRSNARRGRPRSGHQDDTTSDSEYDSQSSQESNTHAHPSNGQRCHFDNTMFDPLERIIIVKVFSHQLNADFNVRDQKKIPSPNQFITSANQFADNAAEQARHMITGLPANYEQLFYPAFSPDWCFTIDGQITNKGATKILRDRFDNELLLRVQHREKQGLFYRLLNFIGLRAEHIGNESLLRTIIQLVAPCWTRCIYRFPPLANLIWKSWYRNLPPDLQATTSSELPRGWQKNPAPPKNEKRQPGAPPCILYLPNTS